jgi:hypothetical protein
MASVLEWGSGHLDIYALIDEHDASVADEQINAINAAELTLMMLFCWNQSLLKCSCPSTLHACTHVQACIP